jgi:hypothetical protein
VIICLPGHLSPFCLWKGENALEGSRTTALCDIRLRLWRKAAMHTWFCVHVMLVQKVSRCMQRLHLQVILLLCLESAILLPLNYIRATGAHKPRHLDSLDTNLDTSTPPPHGVSLDRPRQTSTQTSTPPRQRLDSLDTSTARALM